MNIYTEEDLEKYIKARCEEIEFSHSLFFYRIDFYCDIYLLQIVYLINRYYKLDITRFKNRGFGIFFSECLFNKKFIIRKFLDLNLNDFYIEFSFCKCMDVLKISEMKLNILDFINNNEFEDSIFIENSNFGTLIFYGDKLKKELHIKNCQFTEFCFHYSTSPSYFFIEECSFKDFSFLSSKLNVLNIIHFKTDQIKIQYCDIINMRCSTALVNTYCEFFSCSMNTLFFESFLLLNQQIIFYNLNIKNMNREVARTLKNEAYKRNNNILGTEYKVLEMDEYRKEVANFKTLGTYFLLSLNKWSNNYGISWVRGIFFILICWVIFFSLFVQFRDGFGGHFIWNDPAYIKEAISYLWLLDGINEISKCEIVNWPMAVCFVLGKILIAYGIYQTISAFRRFGK